MLDILEVIRCGRTSHARHVRGCSVWTEDVPPHLSHVFFADYGWFYLIKVQSLDSKKKKKN